MLRATGLPVVVCGDFDLNSFNPLNLRYITESVENMYELGMFPCDYDPDKV